MVSGPVEVEANVFRLRPLFRLKPEVGVFVSINVPVEVDANIPIGFKVMVEITVFRLRSMLQAPVEGYHFG